MENSPDVKKPTNTPERTPEQMALYWKTLADCKRDVSAWPNYVKRAYVVKQTDESVVEHIKHAAPKLYREMAKRK